MKNKNFAKLITVVLVLAAIMTAFAVTAFADGAAAAVTTDKQSVARGEEVVVSVSVAAENVTSAKLKLSFDESIFEVKSRKFTDVLVEDELGLTSEKDGMFAMNDGVTVDLTADKAVYVVTLKVKDNAAIGNAKVSLKAMIEANYEKLPDVNSEASVNVTCAAAAHTWNNATCTASKTCSTCGLAEGEALGHDWEAATCQAPKTCKREGCGATEGNVGMHICDIPKISDEYLKSPASCSSAAIYYFKCRTCAEKGTETFSYGSALDHTGGTATCTEKAVCEKCGAEYGDFAHTYDQLNADSAYIANPATCTAKAKYYKSCVCGAVGNETFEVGELAAHNYIEKVEAAYLKSEATCASKAIYYKSCSDCSAKGEVTFEVGEKLAHTFGEEWKGDKNGHWNVCECGEKSAVKDHTWNKGEVTKEATEESFGTKTFTCTKCSETKSESIPKLAPKADDGDATIWIIGGVALVVAVVVIFVVVFRKVPASKADPQFGDEETEEASEEKVDEEPTEADTDEEETENDDSAEEVTEEETDEESK